MKEVRTNKRPIAKEAANLIAGLLYSTIRRPSMLPGVAHFLLAGKDVYGTHLYDLFPDGSITLIDDFISSGSGSVFAYGVLETHFKKDMTTDEGVKLALLAVNTALKRDSASGNGINVLVVNKDEIKRVMHKELVCEL